MNDQLGKAVDPDLRQKIMVDIVEDSLTNRREMFKLAVRMYIAWLGEIAKGLRPRAQQHDDDGR